VAALWSVVLFLLVLSILWAGPAYAQDDDDDAGDFVNGEVVVKLNLHSAGATIEDINRDYGTTVKDEVLMSAGIYLLKLPQGSDTQTVASQMAADTRLLYAEPNFTIDAPEGGARMRARGEGLPVPSSDPTPYSNQYAVDALNLPEAHNVGRGNEVVVAVLDTGMQQDHPELQNSLTLARYDFVEDESSPADAPNGLDDDGDTYVDEMTGHGTHVAGIVHLAAPEAQIMPLRVLDSDGSGNVFVIAEAIRYAVRNGADVINLSLGSSRESDLLEDVFEDLAPDDDGNDDDGAAMEGVPPEGVITTASAGNENTDALHYPAADDGVIAVTSVNQEEIKSDFANYGSDPTGWVDIAAPGEGIHSTFSTSGYASWSGTSMAAPFVAGQAALIRGLRPEWDPAAVEKSIRDTARSLDAKNPSYASKLGAGHADIGASMGALSPSVSCGQELTESTLLTNNLSECPGDGLVIGADGIIIDLDGHTIDGTGLGSGIRNDGYDSVTITNGTVQDFDYGVELLSETERNVLKGLTLERNQLAGIELFDAAEGNEVLANTVKDNGAGIALVSGTRGTLVVDNTMTLNGGAGLLVRDSNANRLERNIVEGGGDLGVGLERASANTVVGNTVSANSDGGIQISAGSNANRVEANTVTESGDMGILVAESDRTELISNTTHGMSDSGITLESANDGVVRANDLRFNPGGLQMDGSSRNLIESNTANETTGIGIELGGGSFDNDLVRNTANANAAQGIYVADEALLEPGNLLDRNTASGNLSDGIVTAKGGHVLTANVALDNKGWGINAALGIIDGGGNKASSNVEPLQCFGIVCSQSTDLPLPDPSDSTAPETTVDSGPSGIVSSATASFNFSSNDSDATFECKLDIGAFESCTSPKEYPDLSEGSHTFEVRATDTAGNTDATPDRRTWTVAAPPDTTVVSGPSGNVRSTSASFSFSSSEAGSTFQCSRDGSAFAGCTSPKSYSSLSQGNHTFWVRAVDKAGNIDATPASRSWFVDTVVPKGTIAINGGNASTTSRSVTLGLSASDPSPASGVAWMRFRNGRTTWSSWFAYSTSKWWTLTAGAGTKTVYVQYKDRAGNISAAASDTIRFSP
jgi:parallel beta-helix repeat protein